VFDLNVSPLATPLEAALLENDLIKEHDPPYNRALKKRGRSLVYFSSDFASASALADHVHVLGPFPRGSTIESLVLLAQVLQTKSFEPSLFWGLLDQESTDRALLLFFAQYKEDVDLQDSAQVSAEIGVRNLLALGLCFYRRHLLDTLVGGVGSRSLALTYFLGPKAVEAEEVEVDDISEPDRENIAAGAKEPRDLEDLAEESGAGEDQQNDTEQLSDEDLVQMVRSLVIGAARTYLRARTLVRLLDASISYEEKNRRRKLVFERGHLVRSEDISHLIVAEESAQRVFRPAGRSSMAAPIDLATYDRMCVLLAEIRRLHSRGHWISLTEADLVIS